MNHLLQKHMINIESLKHSQRAGREVLCKEPIETFIDSNELGRGHPRGAGRL